MFENKLIFARIETIINQKYRINYFIQSRAVQTIETVGILFQIFSQEMQKFKKTKREEKENSQAFHHYFNYQNILNLADQLFITQFVQNFLYLLLQIINNSIEKMNPQPPIYSKPDFYLLFKLQNIQFRNHEVKANQFIYFSFSIEEQMYFSSCVDPRSNILNDDILVPVFKSSFPQVINLHRWENHMIMFSHEIDISELKNRKTTKKKHQTKAGEILSFIIIVLNEQQLKFGDKYVQSISQHYLFIEQMKLKTPQDSQPDTSLSYFTIKTSNSSYIMPVINGQICIQLPQTFVFQYIRNGKIICKSKQYNANEIQFNNSEIALYSDRKELYIVNLKIRWCINFFEAKIENTLLLQAHQILIYDIQVRFDSYNEFANAKVKFVYGTKGFEVGSEFNTSKPTKLRKIIYFIIKSQDEQIDILVQKNLKIIGLNRFFTDEINSYMVHNINLKLTDNNGKAIGNVKFKCEKAKSLSTPNNNKFWKDTDRKKLANSILLSLEQLSIEYNKNQPTNIVIKTEDKQRIIKEVPNLKFYNKNIQISKAPLILEVKSEENMYLMLKNQQTNQQQTQNNHINVNANNDFIGIAILNFNELRLGTNSTQIFFFKNQQKTATANCIINKVIPYPFIKSSFQPEVLNIGINKTITLSLLMKKITFMPYFYTYQYDNKNEVYCIMEVNKMKKVLIMENSEPNSLNFVPSSSSDNLNFYIEQSQYIKIKVTFLVSDIGSEEQIFGSSLIKIKLIDLNVNGNRIALSKNQLKNDFGTVVGLIDMEVYVEQEHSKTGQQSNPSKIQTQESGSGTGPFKHQIRRVKNSLDKVNQNIELMEQSIKKKGKSPPPIIMRRSQQKPSIHQLVKQAPERYNKSINFSNLKIKPKRQRNHSVAGTNNNNIIKLPAIPDPRSKKNNLQDLINMMRIRKRDAKGYYEQNPAVIPIQARYPTTERVATYENKINYHHNQTPMNSSRDVFHQDNQKLERGVQSILPFQKSEKDKTARKQNIRKEIKAYEQKLKGLKNVLGNLDENQNLIQNEPHENIHQRSKGFSQIKINQNNYNYKQNTITIENPGEAILDDKNKLPELEDNEFARMPE